MIHRRKLLVVGCVIDNLLGVVSGFSLWCVEGCGWEHVPTVTEYSSSNQIQSNRMELACSVHHFVWSALFYVTRCKKSFDLFDCCSHYLVLFRLEGSSTEGTGLSILLRPFFPDTNPEQTKMLATSGAARLFLRTAISQSAKTATRAFTTQSSFFIPRSNQVSRRNSILAVLPI